MFRPTLPRALGVRTATVLTATMFTATVVGLPPLAETGAHAVTAPPAAAAPATAAPPVRHVFVINLENKGYDQTFGASSPAPYLSRELRAKGQLLTQFYGVAHNSLPNYLAQISGQGPNPQTQGDCQVYSDFAGTGTVAPQQAVGSGCVYPASVQTVADQLQAKGLTWKGYSEDMGTPCRHPAVGAPDDTQKAEPDDQYAARHNPFVYFHSIIDSPACAANDVPLERLTADLASVATAPNLSYITPDLCHDGHDAPCANGEPGGLVSADAWLRTWVPRILASPAFARDGLLIVTFDEADNQSPDSAAACCGEGPGPNTPMPGIYGMGGGRVGAVVVSPFVSPGSWNNTEYNHYGLLRTIENTFGLPPLGYAADARGFGFDVWWAR
jgi:phospholipase C